MTRLFAPVTFNPKTLIKLFLPSLCLAVKFLKRLAHIDARPTNSRDTLRKRSESLRGWRSAETAATLMISRGTLRCPPRPRPTVSTPPPRRRSSWCLSPRRPRRRHWLSATGRLVSDEIARSPDDNRTLPNNLYFANLTWRKRERSLRYAVCNTCVCYCYWRGYFLSVLYESCDKRVKYLYQLLRKELWFRWFPPVRALDAENLILHHGLKIGRLGRRP